MEDVDSPLVNVRPVKNVLLVIVTGDRGLCGGYNNFVLKKVHTLTWFKPGIACDLPAQANGNFAGFLPCQPSGYHWLTYEVALCLTEGHANITVS